ncbi:MAG: hypothetical protein ACYSWP_16270 [Planctomycetota bacterium]
MMPKRDGLFRGVICQMLGELRAGAVWPDGIIMGSAAVSVPQRTAVVLNWPAGRVPAVVQVSVMV